MKRNPTSILCAALLSCVLVTVPRLPAESRLFAEWKSDPESALLPDFSYAGYAYGETDLPMLPSTGVRIFKVDDFGAVPGDGESDQWAIQRAIDTAAVAGGGIVKLGAGTYEMNKDDGQWSLMIRHSNIILAGEGSDKTSLLSLGEMKRPLGPWAVFPMILVAAPELKGYELQYGYGMGQPPFEHDWYASEGKGEMGKYFHAREADRLTRLTAPAPRNSRKLQVESAEGLEPGQLVVLCLQDKAVAKDLLGPWEIDHFSYLTMSWDNREGDYGANLVRQIVTIDSIKGTTVTIKERLRWDYDPKYEAIMLRWPHIRNVGIEGITLSGKSSNNVPATKTSLYFVNVFNGWGRDVNFFNMKTALNITQSKNVTFRDSTLDGEAGKTGDYFGGFHNSYKFLGHSSDNLIANAKIKRGVTHGFSTQAHANGNVFLECELPPVDTDGMNSRMDFHSQLPMANLYDRMKNGNLKGSGGNERSQPHAGPLNVFWNWESEISGVQSIWKGYRAYQLQLVRPVWVGLQGEEDLEVEFAANNDFDINEKVVVESIGKAVEPESLYRAQVRGRLGREPGPGVHLSITGPARVFAGEAAEWSAGGSVPAGHAIWWKVGNESSKGGKLSHVFDKAGNHSLTAAAVGSDGSVHETSHEVEVFAREGVLIDTSGHQINPISRNVVQRGCTLQTFVSDNRFSSDLSGDDLLLRSEIHSKEKLHFGGMIVAWLPESGVSLEKYRLKADASVIGDERRRGDIYLSARDAEGNWARSTDELEGQNPTGSFANMKWEPLYGQFNLPTGEFDPGRVTAVGLLCWMDGVPWTKKEPKFRLSGLRIETNE